MMTLSDQVNAEKARKEWREKRILIAIQAFSELHPMPRKEKRPDLAASKTAFNKVFLRSASGVLVAIYGEVSGNFWKLTPEKIKKHSIIIKPLKVQTKSIKPPKR